MVRIARHALLLSIALLPADLPAQEVDPRERWVPSFALSFSTLNQRAEGAIRTSEVLGPPRTTGCPGAPPGSTLCTDSPLLVVPQTDNSDVSVAPKVDASIELMTPRLFDAFGSPQLFLHTDLSVAFAFERNLAGERSPSKFESPELRSVVTDIPEIAVGGQGSRAKSQVQPLVIAAGLGTAFTATILWDRTLRIKPSIEYLTQSVELTGKVKRAVKQVQPARNLGTLDDFRLIALHETDEERQHALGLGLELEVDSSRLGPFLLSFFVQGRGYRFLGDIDYTLRTSNEFGETAEWQFEFDSFAWQAGAGIRFRYLPQ